MGERDLETIEEAIEFGKRIASIDRLLGHTINVLCSTVWSDDMKRKTASDLGPARNFVQEIIDTVDQKYAGIGVAQEAKEYAVKRLEEVERAARPYLG